MIRNIHRVALLSSLVASAMFCGIAAKADTLALKGGNLYASPEAANGGMIGLVRDGDALEIDIPNRTIRLAVAEAELASRRAEQDARGWTPAEQRKRNVTTALKAYAAFASSANRGAARRSRLRESRRSHAS